MPVRPFKSHWRFRVHLVGCPREAGQPLKLEVPGAETGPDNSGRSSEREKGRSPVGFYVRWVAGTRPPACHSLPSHLDWAPALGSKRYRDRRQPIRFTHSEHKVTCYTGYRATHSPPKLPASHCTMTHSYEDASGPRQTPALCRSKLPSPLGGLPTAVCKVMNMSTSGYYLYVRTTTVTTQPHTHGCHCCV